jgi:hypothetical protein
MDYEPSPDVKPFTLDERLYDVMLSARQNELK